MPNVLIIFVCSWDCTDLWYMLEAMDKSILSLWTNSDFCLSVRQCTNSVSSWLYQPLFIQDTTSFTCLIPYHVYMLCTYIYNIHVCISPTLHWLVNVVFYQVVSLFANSRDKHRKLRSDLEVTKKIESWSQTDFSLCHGKLTISNYTY